jgi:putative ABC transport system permease protein
MIATPTAYFLGSLWLSNFAYKTDIGVSVFLLAGVISLVLAVLTVSYHTIKAAITNPINSLRYE